MSWAGQCDDDPHWPGAGPVSVEMSWTGQCGDDPHWPGAGPVSVEMSWTGQCGDDPQRPGPRRVPGVAENRPSVLRADHLFVSKSDDQSQPITRYKGYVHAVELERVKLGFSQKLLAAFIPNMRFNVSFTFNRLPLQFQHRAAQLAEDTNLKDVLFPTYSDGRCIHPYEKSLVLYDRSLENNPEQAAAVKCIVSGISRPAPYLVFGPPGTGKTVTIVEAIKQGRDRTWDLGAVRLASAKFPAGHFSHVFIDEAGHAVEPECVIAIADLSLLERLMDTNTLYQKNPDSGSYNQHFVTKLLRNYRSHPTILEIPNELFYDNELMTYADPLITESYCQWQHLPKKDFPIIFHGVLGEDQREEKSPSFFNVDEIDKVLFYLKKLLTDQGKKGIAKISPKEIGVISPYRKQVEKIRRAITKLDKELMAMNDIKELKVGSVEEFQGQERKVIIISTVRSSSDYLQMDEDFNLGFLKNPKRFNVALTRAKALLIVVGNPMILRQDPNWNRLLSYCVTKQAYTGYEYESDDHEIDLIDRLEQLSLDTEPTDPDVVSIIQQQLEPEWRSEV
ncbi:hypothetical protein scyTo_0015865 [Scyliorhinus torazame]|uniref:RNA helicase n=1 Tax=Scyliorhinus torazame TaxID=75743 RepID=A0A401PZY9_SCYTO|nr:hypothetical protein [Scyliorhinus torazame]